MLDGVPIASPALVLFQLAGQVHPLRVARACDNAWAMGLVSGRGLHALLDQLAEHGRNGITVMREILAERPPGYVPPASGLERRFARILEEAGEEPMRRQVDVGGEAWVGRVDFADPSLPLLVEINSERYHSALLDRQADQARYEALRAAGFTVLVFWDTEVWHEPHRVVLEVRRARVASRAGFPVGVLARTDHTRV
ncbi:MAG: endonuclease domain-containing protein [Acidimicrobiia bacterium]